MRYFLIALIASCLISCGQSNPFVSPGGDSEFAAKLPGSDAPVGDISDLSPVIISKDGEVSESAETGSDKAVQSDEEASVAEVTGKNKRDIAVNKAKSDEELSITENYVSKRIIRKLDPENQMVHQLIAFVKSELEKDGRKGSPVFDRYIEKIVKSSLDDFTKVEKKREEDGAVISRKLIAFSKWRDHKHQYKKEGWVFVREWIDVNKWGQKSAFFEALGDSPSCELESSSDDNADFPFQVISPSDSEGPSCKLIDSSAGNVLIAPSKGLQAYKLSDRVSVFDELAYLSYLETSDFKDWIKIGDKEELALFTASLNGEYTDHNPDRIVILHSPGLEDFIHQEGVFDEKKEKALDEQGHRLSRLASYIRATDAPVHVIGLCDYFCSSYVIPHASEVYIEPLGEVAFNGNHKIILDTFEGLLKEEEENYFNSILHEVSDLDAFSEYVHKHLASGHSLLNMLEKEPGYEALFKRIKDVTHLKPLHAFSLEEKKSFLESLSVYYKTAIWNFLHENEKSPEKDRIEKIQVVVKRLREFHEAFHKVFSLHFSEEYLQNHALNRLYYYSGLLTSSSIIEKFHHFSDGNRVYGPKEGEDGVLYTVTSPQSGILRNFGINIHGKNFGYTKYRYIKYPTRAAIPASIEMFKNCGFFTYGASFNTPKRLTRCLAGEEKEIKRERSGGVEI